MMLGLPCFIVGSVSLGLALIGVVPAAAIGAAIPIILTATAIGLFLATIWAASLGQNAVASVFGIFAGFWLSYAVLVLGLTHGWFGIAPASVQATQELFLVAWLVLMTLLTLTTLRLPAWGSTRGRPACSRRAGTWRSCSPRSARTCTHPPPRSPPAGGPCRWAGPPSASDITRLSRTRAADPFPPAGVQRAGRTVSRLRSG
jgi:hypothetical protein